MLILSYQLFKPHIISTSTIVLSQISAILMPIKKAQNIGKRCPCNAPCAPSEIMRIGSWIQQSEKSGESKSLAKHVGRKHLQMEFPPCVPGNKRSRKRHLRLLRERKLRQFRLNIGMLYCLISCPAKTRSQQTNKTQMFDRLFDLLSLSYKYQSMPQMKWHVEAIIHQKDLPRIFPGDFTNVMFLCLQSIGRPQPQPHCGSCESPANFEFGRSSRCWSLVVAWMLYNKDTSFQGTNICPPFGKGKSSSKVPWEGMDVSSQEHMYILDEKQKPSGSSKITCGVGHRLRRSSQRECE